MRRLRFGPATRRRLSPFEDRRRQGEAGREWSLLRAVRDGLDGRIGFPDDQAGALSGTCAAHPSRGEVARKKGAGFPVRHRRLAGERKRRRGEGGPGCPAAGERDGGLCAVRGIEERGSRGEVGRRAGRDAGARVSGAGQTRRSGRWVGWGGPDLKPTRGPEEWGWPLPARGFSRHRAAGRSGFFRRDFVSALRAAAEDRWTAVQGGRAGVPDLRLEQRASRPCTRRRVGPS